MPTRQRLRIAFFATSFDAGGAERQMLLLARELRSSHDVSLVVLRRTGLFEATANSLGVPVHDLRWSATTWREGRATYVVGALRGFLNYLRVARDFDVVEAWLPAAYAVAGFAQPFVRVPVVVAGRRVMSDFEGSPGPVRRRLAALATRSADVVVANAAAVACDTIRAERLAPSKVVVIRNGIDLFDLSPSRDRLDHRRGWGITESEVVVGSVANYKPGKGLGELVRAARQLRGRYPRLRFVLVGEGPSRAGLEREIAAWGLESIVILHGAHPDAVRVYPAFDIAVHASDSEGLPNAVLEAAAWGKPIVATDVGGTNEVVRHEREALLVAPRDADALAAGIERLIEDPDLAQRLGERAQLRVREEFSPARLASETARLHAALYAQSRNARTRRRS